MFVFKLWTFDLVSRVSADEVGGTQIPLQFRLCSCFTSHQPAVMKDVSSSCNAQIKPAVLSPVAQKAPQELRNTDYIKLFFPLNSASFHLFSFIKETFFSKTSSQRWITSSHILCCVKSAVSSLWKKYLVITSKNKEMFEKWIWKETLRAVW